MTRKDTFLTQEFAPDSSSRPYVVNITYRESIREDAYVQMPFFADGYPGIVYHQTDNGLTLLPGNKQLSPFFLYGQTLAPIELSVWGPFKLLIFQLSPFVPTRLFGLTPKTINDDCYDLAPHQAVETNGLLQQLARSSPQTQVNMITTFLNDLGQQSAHKIDRSVQQAIQILLASKGVITIRQLREQLSMTERTMERRFAAAVGVTPKQFARIIQFQSSLTHISEEAHARLIDAAYIYGFADQSHFTRTFKHYTGRTPSEHQKIVAR
ncbi:MAG: helix-turn-helix domain-containing protein [Tunicatimonas sp.]